MGTVAMTDTSQSKKSLETLATNSSFDKSKRGSVV